MYHLQYCFHVHKVHWLSRPRRNESFQFWMPTMLFGMGLQWSICGSTLYTSHWTMLTLSSSHISFVLLPLLGRSGQRFSSVHWWSFPSIWRGWLTSPQSWLTIISITGFEEILYMLIWISIWMMFHGMTLHIVLVICLIGWRLVTWKGTLISVSLFWCLYIYLDGPNLWSSLHHTLTQKLDISILDQITLVLFLWKRSSILFIFLLSISEKLFQILDAIFNNQFQAILRRGNNNVLSLLSCGSLTTYMEPQSQIKEFANKYVSKLH